MQTKEARVVISQKALYPLKMSNVIYFILSVALLNVSGLAIVYSIAAGIGVLLSTIVIAKLLFQTKICEENQDYVAFYSTIISWILVAFLLKWSIIGYFSGIGIYIVTEVTAIVIFGLLKGKMDKVVKMSPVLLKKEIAEHSQRFGQRFSQRIKRDK